MNLYSFIIKFYAISNKGPEKTIERYGQRVS